MVNKKTLFVQATEVNQLLTEYIAVHNEMNKKSGFTSLFRKIDFSELLQNAKAVYIKTDNKIQELNLVKKEKYNGFNIIEKQFFDCLLEYSLALKSTAKKLVALLEALYKRANNENKLSWKTYKTISKEYDDSTKHYAKLGQDLMTQYNRLLTNLTIDNVTIDKDFTVNEVMSMDDREAEKYQEILNGMTFKI